MKEVIFHKSFEFARGLAVFIFLWIVVIVMVRFQLLFPYSILLFLSQTADPRSAMYAFGALVSSGILILFRMGVELPMFKSYLTGKVRVYLTGLPMWFIGIALAISALGLFIILPSCQPPTSVTFEVDGVSNPLYPNDTLTAKPSERITVTAKPAQTNAILSCKWQYTGNVFRTIGSSIGCQISVDLAQTPGDGFLSVQASQNFCGQGNIFSIHVQTK